jgi:hypothetical protein
MTPNPIPVFVAAAIVMLFGLMFVTHASECHEAALRQAERTRQIPVLGRLGVWLADGSLYPNSLRVGGVLLIAVAALLLAFAILLMLPRP